MGWFGNAVIAIRRKARRLLHGAVRPDDFEICIPGARAEAENNTVIVTREKTAASRDPAGQRLAAFSNREAGADRVADAASAVQLNPQPVVSGGSRIAKQ